MAKWICPVCGYVHEGETAPEKCPLCKVPGSKFNKMEENKGLQFVTEHVIGIAKDIPQTEEGAFILQGLKDHFNGECTEVGMYLAMSRQADREGYQRSLRHSSAMLSRRQSTQLASLRCSVRWYGIQRQM